MEVASPKIARGSVPHRLLGFTTGYAPPWFCTRNACTGFDFLDVLAFIGFLALLLLFQFYSVWTGIVGLVPIVCWWILIGSFKNRERWGRARRRRIECVWCGRKGTPSGSDCPACQRRT